MHVSLVFRRFHLVPLKWLFFSLVLFKTAYLVSTINAQFHIVAKSKLFIDRSLLIVLLLRKLRIHPWIADHSILIGARKSGKSTNLSMLKQFFELCVDESGRILAPNATKHYVLFKSLKIGQTPFFEHFFARIPVIHLNLADFDVTRSERDFKQSFCKVIRDLMSEHKHAFEIKGNDSFREERIKALRDKEACEKKDMTSIAFFGRDVVKYVYDYYQTRVLVLIDEIEAPTMSVLDSNVKAGSADFVGHVFSFVRRMIQDNTAHVMGSFLTGATKQGTFFMKMMVFTGYVFEERLKYFYGVTEAEVRRLLSISGIPMTATLMQELRDMYGSYGLTDVGSKEFVFNTQSILKFCEGKVIRPYWDAAPGIAPFKKLLTWERGGRFLEKAMHSEVRIFQGFMYYTKTLAELKEYLSGKIKKPPIQSWSMEEYLWESGFLRDCPSNKSRENSYAKYATVTNDENRLILLDLVLNKDYFMAKHLANETQVRNFAASVAKLNASEISFKRLAESISHLFIMSTKDLNNEVAFRYALYSYLQQTDGSNFGKVFVILGQKTARKSDLIVTLKGKLKVFIGLALDNNSGQDALRQVLEDKQVHEISKLNRGEFICLGINLQRNDSRCDVSYLFGSTNYDHAQNVSRTYGDSDYDSDQNESWISKIFFYP